MPIDLTAPLSWKSADTDELSLLQNLQGNILKGHGREFTANIFFKLNPTKKVQAKRMLRELANFHLTSAYRQLLDVEHFKATGEGGGAFTHIALSFNGYKALGLASSAPNDPDFKAGMKAPASISALGDPPVSSWESAFRDDIHGLVLVGEETEGVTAALAGAIRELITDAGGTIIHVQHGKALRNAEGEGIEHFGYVDGRSQPLLLQEDIDAEIASAGSSRWDPAFPLNAALVKDPGTTDTVSFGSFFVFRKLEQAVRGFKTQEQIVANALGLNGNDRELAGALIVGRFENGTPTTQSNTARNEVPANNFNYQGDPGSRCPFHAHIRKVNPRGTGGAEPEAAERKHIMPRRGIPFEDVKRTTHPEELPESANMADFTAHVSPLLPKAGIGLLFMAYNEKIAEQFKFTQQIWANNANFPLAPPGPHGIDPIIGQGPNNPGDQKITKVWDDASSGVITNAPFAGFVTMRGGEYFFSPSLTFLLNL